MKDLSLHTKRLFIKRLRPADAVVMFRYRTDPSVTRFQSWHPTELKEVRDFIINNSRHDFALPETWFQLGIYLRASGELIGDIGLYFLNKGSRDVEIGYTITPHHQRQGYAFEAVRAVITHLFNNLQIQYIHAIVLSHNAASIALLKKLGAHPTNNDEFKVLFEMENNERHFIIQNVSD